MNQFRYKLAQFMAGRNGQDQLGFATIALYFLVFVLGMFIPTVVLPIIGFAIVAYNFYRFFSKDLLRRRRENAAFLKLFNGVKAFFRQQARRLKDIKTHRYRTCPGCKVTLRLPVKRGKNTVVCPRCQRRVQVRVWF